MGLGDWSLERLAAEARRRGVLGVETMTRRELIDALEPSRSPIGAVRRLLGRVVDRVRGAVTSFPPPPPPRHAARQRPRPRAPTPPAGEPILTRTLAGLLAHQGHDERALAIYDHLCALSPDDPDLAREAEATRARVRTGTKAASDEVVAVEAKGGALLVSWRLEAGAIARAVELLGVEGTLAARVVIVAPDAKSVVRSDVVERVPVDPSGEWLVSAVPKGARCAASVGLLGAERFVSVAHARVIRMS